VHLRVAGLGGTFAPTWYDKLADKRRHFVREQVCTCSTLRQIDVLLTHEAARPFRPFTGGRGPDAGKAQINEVLEAVRPRLHLFGHHHRFSEQEREGVRSVGLDLVSRSYLLIDARTLEYELHAAA
jgi:Icc-related predicted phosphoesterase